MKTFLKVFLLFSLTLFISNRASAQFDSDIRSITMVDGLSDNTVMSIYQDDDGFVWFGTEYGLSRYDGVGFSNFNKPDFNIITDIVGTSGKTLWVLGNSQLISFDRKHERFIPVYWKQGSTRLNAIQSLAVQNDTTLWATNKGIAYCITLSATYKEDGSISHFQANTRQSFDYLQDNSLTQLCFDSKGRLAIASTTGKLLICNPDNLEVLKIVQWTSEPMIESEPSISTDELCDRCGFSSRGRFNTTFKDFYGITPGEFKLAIK